MPLYAMTAIRIDLASAIGILSRFMLNSNTERWQGVRQILQKLKGTLDYSLFFDGSWNEDILSGYANGDYVGDLDTRKFISGYFLLGSCCVSWCSKQQSTVAKSSTEAEYIALSSEWSNSFVVYLLELVSKRNRLFENNRGVIDLLRKPKFHDHTEHIDIYFHSCCERVQNDNILVSTAHQIRWWQALRGKHCQKWSLIA